MDVTLPELDGVEATRRIRRSLPDVRVLMLTMHADADVVDRALKAGASGYLIKDCTIEEVAQAVRMAADGETAMSRDLAMRMLTEVKNLAVPTARAEDRIITKREEEVLQLIAAGGNAYYLAKFDGILGLDMPDIGAQQTGMSKEEFRAKLVAAGK